MVDLMEGSCGFGLKFSQIQCEFASLYLPLSLAKVKIYEFQEYRVSLYFRIHFQPWAHLIFNVATFSLVHGQSKVPQKMKEISILL
jgi:hypothetical protein